MRRGTGTTIPVMKYFRSVSTNQPASAGVLIADDHGILRDCLSALLDRQRGMKVIGTAATGVEAVDAAVRLKPSVITMNLLLPTLNGLDASRRIIKALPDTRIVIVSGFHTSEQVYQTFRCGALAYVAKESTGAELITAIRTVLTGNRYISPMVGQVNHRDVPGRVNPISPLNSLSDREREVMRLTISGLSSAETGRILSLSQKTVDTYRSRLMAKLGVSNLTQLVRFALENSAESQI
jgi:DNA-binding NarL/FixJ family response regulator